MSLSLSQSAWDTNWIKFNEHKRSFRFSFIPNSAHGSSMGSKRFLGLFIFPSSRWGDRGQAQHWIQGDQPGFVVLSAVFGYRSLKMCEWRAPQLRWTLRGRFYGSSEICLLWPVSRWRLVFQRKPSISVWGKVIKQKQRDGVIFELQLQGKHLPF